MAAERLSMRKIREGLRLAAAGHSHREIGRSLNISHNSVAEYLRRAVAAGLSWPLPPDLDDAELEGRLFPGDGASKRARPLPDWAELHQELKRKSVTLQLLWIEYKATHPDGYQYTQFVERYRAWEAVLEPVLRHEHKAGEKVFVDYAGQTLSIVDRQTGELREAQLFVGVLGASNYTFAEVTWTQSLPDWIRSHVRMYTFFQGVPAITVPDNVKTGVRHACYYEPDLNRTYLELGQYYGTTIIPTRVAKPRDKAKVETGVQIAERWLLAPLRNHTLFSLSEANEEIAHRLHALNRRPFQKLEGNRATLFETLDRPALLSLPAVPYSYAEWKKARVNIDYHIEVGRHYYSVPWQLLRVEVDVRLTATTVEVFHHSQRVAVHVRGTRVGGHTTEASHRPLSHQKHLEWTPSRMIRWGQSVGAATGTLVQRIMESKQHPEQGYRACLGLLRLSKQYSPERLEAAAFRALRSGTHTYRSVRSILEHSLDRVPIDEQTALALPEQHENLR
ncbi:MAG: IS21 family transposase, partial [Polaromonas sp.]